MFFIVYTILLMVSSIYSIQKLTRNNQRLGNKMEVDGRFNRGVTTGGEGEGGWGPQLQYPNPRRSNSFSFKHQRYCFLRGVQKLYGPETLRFLPCMLQFLDNIRRLFIFSNCRIQQFMMDRLKSFLLGTIQKKTTMNESLNRLQTESWTY